MNKRYTHIFFDLDNTLWDFEKNSRNAMLEAFRFLRLETFAEFDVFFKIYSRHNRALWDSYRNKLVGKKELTRLRFQNTFDEMEISSINADTMNTLYLNEMPKQKELNEGVIDTLDYLKAKRYHLNIITNGFKEVQNKKIETSGLKPYFDKIFVSEEIKTPKPDRRIFEYAIKSVNAKKVNSIMIGDDLDVDVMGAIKFGIDAIYFQRIVEIDINKIIEPSKKMGYMYKIDKINQLSALF